MTPEQFVYWLQGYFELTDQKGLSYSQIDVIKEHLKTVFKKVTKKEISKLELDELAKIIGKQTDDTSGGDVKYCHNTVIQECSVSDPNKPLIIC